MPPFNRPPAGVQLPDGAKLYEIPVYGLRISNALTEFFKEPEVVAYAEELHATQLLPHYAISDFVQGKMFKVRTLIEEARKRDDCKSGTNAEGVKKLERFVTAFEAVKSSDIGGFDAWHTW